MRPDRRLPVPMHAGLALALLSATPVAASSEEAWDAFRRQVETNCRALTDPAAPAEVTVHPFGSGRHGVALLRLPGAGGEVMVCIMDKATGAAELTPPFAPPMP